MEVLLIDRQVLVGVWIGLGHDPFPTPLIRDQDDVTFRLQAFLVQYNPFPILEWRELARAVWTFDLDEANRFTGQRIEINGDAFHVTLPYPAGRIDALPSCLRVDWWEM